MDPQTRRHIWACLRRLRTDEGVTLFMTTHYMDEAEECDRIAIIDGGQIVALGDQLPSPRLTRIIRGVSSAPDIR